MTSLSPVTTDLRIAWALLAIGLLAAQVRATDARTAVFSGSWETDVGDDIFRLDLVQRGRFICGSHLSSIDRGNHVSERESDEPPTVLGVVNGSKAIITINDGDFVAHGTLTMNRGTLIWKAHDRTQITTARFETDAIWISAKMATTVDHQDFLKEAKTACENANFKAAVH